MADQKNIQYDYVSFLSAVTRNQWRKIGTTRRSGVSAPLFSLHSSKSIGIGEFPDLELLARWCKKTGMSIIQLLPMNDTGFNFTPYDAASTFALDPMYLSIEKITGVNLRPFRKDIDDLKKRFPAGQKRVDYGVKAAKLALLLKIFSSLKKLPEEFQFYVRQNIFWLDDYAVYKVAKENQSEARWEDWEEGLRSHDDHVVREFAAANVGRMHFHQWMQWQLFLQASAASASATSRDVLIMGDLPFLVSRDSADVWSHQDYFNLDLVSGAPPDAFFAMGQRWGMPPYRWDRIAANGYDYLTEKVKYSANFYDLFRIDHVVGTFRLWTIPLSEPAENAGLNGTFDPPEEWTWEEHGRKILSVMIESSNMLPCAEDLGVVPPCSYKVLAESAIPGMDVQRWTKYWDSSFDFKQPQDYRKNAAAVISNHDMTSFRGWWEFEAGTTDEKLFERKCRERGIDFPAVKGRLFDLERSVHGRLRWKNDIFETRALLEILGKGEHEAGDFIGLYRESYLEKENFCRYLGLDPVKDINNAAVLMERAFEKANATSSIFSIQLLQDLLSLDNVLKEDPWYFRINFPGTSGPHNWSLVLPVSLDAMLNLSVNRKIKRLNEAAGRQ